MRKKMVAIATVVTMLTTGVGNMVVRAVTRTIDNDSIASGYGNYNNGFSYITSSSLYNGDARIAASNSSYYYYWTYPAISFSAPSCNIVVQAYLNHANFTDTAARYTVAVCQNANYTIGTIDQNAAPSGWNLIRRNNLTSLDLPNYFSSADASVNPSGRSGVNTGADAIMVAIAGN